MKRYPIILSLLGLLLVGYCILAYALNYTFEAGCGGHLKRAADANTIEMAISELDTAIQYAQDHKLTTGTTAITLPYPSEDIGFWYQNILASRDELKRIGPDAPQLTKTNMLMKLRETLLDKTQHGESVTVPGGISQYPHNLFYMLWVVGILMGVLFLIPFWLYAAMSQARASRSQARASRSRNLFG